MSNNKYQYSAPRLNGQRFSSHSLADKAGWPFIRANLIEKASLGSEKTGQLGGMAVLAGSSVMLLLLGNYETVNI